MSDIWEVVGEIQSEEKQAMFADKLMVHALYGILGARVQTNVIPTYELKVLTNEAESHAKLGSPIAKRILEILEGK